MTKNNFIIITGGPGGGKSSLLENLSSKGIAYITETARAIIKERLSNGLSPRPDSKTFAQDIFAKDYANYISNSSLSSLLFFDRSFIDSAWQLSVSDPTSYDGIKSTHLINRYNNKVFFAPPWKEIYRNDSERDQTYQEAIEVYEQLYDWYGKHHYDVVVLPKDTIENRTKFILNELLP